MARVTCTDLRKKWKFMIFILGLILSIAIILTIGILSWIIQQYKEKDMSLFSNLKGQKCDALKNCGPYSRCRVFSWLQNSSLVACSCLEGFHGQPPRCRRPGYAQECRRHSDCPDSESCFNQSCINPCEDIVTCGTNARCEVNQHLPFCKCKYHMTGDPFISCDRQDWDTLFVTGGRTGRNDTTNLSEVVDMLTGQVCRRSNFDFPKAVFGSSSGIMFYDNETDSDRSIQYIVCGGSLKNASATAACFHFNHNSQSWETFASLSEPKTNSASCSIPDVFSSIPRGLMVTGGANHRLVTTTEHFLRYKRSQSWSNGVFLPHSVESHCLVQLNKTALILIGGKTHVGSVKETYIFNILENRWFPGPDLITERSAHSCVTRQVNGSFEIWAIGGTGTGQNYHHSLNSVEILHATAMEWIPGPFLPYGVDHSVALYHNVNDTIFLVGGRNNNGKARTSILVMNNYKWAKSDYELEIGRWSHVAVLLPKNILNCSS